jgi:putative sterol carrier protein
MSEVKKEVTKIVSLLNSSSRARELMETWPRVLQLDLDEEESPFYLLIDHGQMAVKESVDKQADLVIQGSGKEFIEVVSGRKDIMYPIAHGQIKLSKGKISEMISFSRILGTIKRGR